MTKLTNTTPTTKKDKNTLYIGIFSFIVIIAIIIFIITKMGGCSNNNSEEQASTTPKPVSVVQENGDKEATLDKNIKNVRKVNFSKSRKAVEKYEKKQKDTDAGNYASAADGYSYLTYKFTSDSNPEYYGTKVSVTDANSLFQYVFYNDKLIETRLQYGNIGEAGYNSIIANLNNTYGAATYSRSYSNGNKESWYKTKSSTLYVYYQSSGVNVYLRKK